LRGSNNISHDFIDTRYCFAYTSAGYHMKRILTDKESNSLEKRIAEVEKKTGAQIVLAVVGRSDSYAEIPWKVFALAVSMTGLFIYAFNLLWPGRCSSATVHANNQYIYAETGAVSIGLFGDF